jgi:hypothetical protein
MTNMSDVGELSKFKVEIWTAAVLTNRTHRFESFLNPAAA